MTLKDIWEWCFHWSNITHIANAYRQDIWVSIHTNDLLINKASLEAVMTVDANKSSAKIAGDLERVSNTSWVKITPGTVHRQNRNSKSEKVTIVSVSSLDRAHAAVTKVTGQVLLLNYEIQQNFSYILTRKGDFLQQKYGSNNLFEDYLGKVHEP